MNLSDFSDQKPGRLVKAAQGYWAYVPNPLPPPIDLSWELVQRISEADQKLCELAGIARTLPNPHLLIGPFIKREAVLSSRIEGTQASLSDLFYFEASGVTTPQAPDVREVENYVKALEYGLARLKDLPLSLRLIREIHEKLMKGVRGEHLTPGEFRKSQNWIGKPGSTLMEATFVPPPPEEMKDALGHLEKYLHEKSPLPLMVRLALVHHQFETIHPFLDGNGRVGRLMITFMLCADGLLPVPLLYLSAFFEKHRQEYYDRLLRVTHHGEWVEWISFFLRGVAEQSQDAIRRSDKLLTLWKKYREKLHTERAGSLQFQLIDALFSSPAITTPFTRKLLRVTTRTALLNIDKLVKAGILREETGKQRYRIFVAPEIIKIVEASEIK